MESFQRIKVIGKGAFGAAILVKRDGKNYVVKEVMLEGLSAREKLEAQNEAKLLRQLDHPYIVKYEDSGVQHGKLWIAMDYCSGGDLDEFINSKRKASLFLTELEALGVFGQVCLALNYMHDKHILHRDLKSKNIFLSSPAVPGKIPMVKLGDFGIAKVLAHTRDKAKTQIGTPYYLSPEICEDKPYGTKSDVWAMGCILYELLALKVPFVAKDIPGLVRRILHDPAPPLPAQYRSIDGLAKLLDSLLRKDFNRRPSIAEVLQEPCVAKNVQLLPPVPSAAPAPAPAPSAAPAYVEPAVQYVPTPSAPLGRVNSVSPVKPPSASPSKVLQAPAPVSKPSPKPIVSPQKAAPYSATPPQRVAPRAAPASIVPSPAVRPSMFCSVSHNILLLYSILFISMYSCCIVLGVRSASASSPEPLSTMS
jgi:NIMA (never in mitosis gene a)-related kinase